MSLKKLFEEDREFNQGVLLTALLFASLLHSIAVKLCTRHEYRLSKDTLGLDACAIQAEASL